MKPPKKLIGLCGYAGSGKDALGSILVIKHGFQRVAFADAVKEQALACGWNGEKDEEGRRLLQDVGMSRREQNADYWIDRALAKFTADNIVVTDVRFPNEMAILRALGGCIVWISRPGVGPVNEHVSESAVHGLAFDCYISNEGSLHELEVFADALADRPACE